MSWPASSKTALMGAGGGIKKPQSSFSLSLGFIANVFSLFDVSKLPEPPLRPRERFGTTTRAPHVDTQPQPGIDKVDERLRNFKQFNQFGPFSHIHFFLLQMSFLYNAL